MTQKANSSDMETQPFAVLTNGKKTVRDMLKLGYLSLLCSKSYADITVTVLIHEAQVARVSFYRSYHSFEDLLEDILDDVIKYLQAEIGPMFDLYDRSAWRSMLVRFFSLIRADSLNTRHILPENLGYMFSKLETKAKQRLTAKLFPDRYLPSIFVTVIFSVAKIWSLTGCCESIDTITDYTLGILERIADVDTPQF